MDELAEKLDIDPVELRRINDTTTRQAPTTGCGRVGRRGARSPSRAAAIPGRKT